METIDEVTRRKINLNKKGVYRVAVRFSENQLIYGYTRHIHLLESVYFYMPSGYVYKEYAIIANFPDVFYSQVDNALFCETNMPEEDKLMKKAYLPHKKYPYSFGQKYEAIENFKLFYDKQVKSTELEFPIAEHFKYTFGLEFETSMGVIPEVDCFKAGLIPLRDGSITGNEYATVKLGGLEGFNLLKKQLDLLKKYTHFNYNCALHVHLGGFPLKKEKVWNLYKTVYNITSDLTNYLPRYCFKTNAFKNNGKNYCNTLPRFDSFEELFEWVTENKFYGSFTQPHPQDLERARKWNIPQRYFMCNFVNLFCYNVNKTVEFRFLSPTYNMEKILTWLYIFNGILMFAESNYRPVSTLREVLGAVYPEEVYRMLSFQLTKLETMTDLQTTNCDYTGSDLFIENRFFDENKII